MKDHGRDNGQIGELDRIGYQWVTSTNRINYLQHRKERLLNGRNQQFPLAPIFSLLFSCRITSLFTSTRAPPPTQGIASAELGSLRIQAPGTYLPVSLFARLLPSAFCHLARLADNRRTSDYANGHAQSHSVPPPPPPYSTQVRGHLNLNLGRLCLCYFCVHTSTRPRGWSGRGRTQP